MTDLLERITADLDRRLGELRPLIEEHERLIKAREALGRGGRSGTVATPRDRGRPSRRRRSAEPPAPASSAPAAARAPRGDNRRKILELVAERPGVSAAEIASATKIKRPVVYTTVGKLVADGAVEKVEIGSVLGYRVPKEQAATGSGS